MDRDEFIERCLQLASEVDWSQSIAESKADQERFEKLPPVQQAQELISNGEQLARFDDAWQRASSYDLASAMHGLILYLCLGVSKEDSRRQIALEADEKFNDVLQGLNPPVTVNDLAWGFREEHPDYESSSIFSYLKDAMIDIKRFGGGKEPASYLPEPFFSYLRNGMVSKLSYEEAIKVFNSSDRFRTYHGDIPEGLAIIRDLRKYFFEAFDCFTFLNKDFEHYDEIMECKKKFLQVYSYESMFAIHVIV